MWNIVLSAKSCNGVNRVAGPGCKTAGGSEDTGDALAQGCHLGLEPLDIGLELVSNQLHLDHYWLQTSSYY